MAEERFDREKMLETVLQQVAGQLRTSLGNVPAAMERIIPAELREADQELDLNAAVLCRSYYRIMRLANNLSDLVDSGEISSERVNDDIVGFCRAFMRRMEQPAEMLGLTLEFRCVQTSCLIAMDALRLERMLLNLLSNAFKFTPKGGTIILDVEIGTEWVLLHLTDTGCGMNEEELAAAFTRYQSAAPVPPPHGLGLGLPLSRRIAEEHGGELSLRSCPGQGTTVTVSLPRVKSKVVRLRSAVKDYTGGFNPVLVELADVLPKNAYVRKYLD